MNGSYRYFLEVNKSAQHFPHFHYITMKEYRRSAVNWCSNDYLCMSTHEEVIAKLRFCYSSKRNRQQRHKKYFRHNHSIIKN